MRKILVTAIVLFAVNSWGQEISRVATCSGQFLKLSIGARATALGEAQLGLTGDLSFLPRNPSIIAEVNRPTVALSHINLYANISHNFFGLSLPVGNGGAVALSVIYLTTDDIEVTTLKEPEGTGAYYKVRDACIGVTYARYITHWLMMGFTVKIVHEGIWRERARSLAVDFGSLLDTGLLGIKLGMSLTNLGADMRLRGEDLRVEHDRFPQNPGERKVASDLTTDKWPLPMVYRMGIATDLVGPTGQILANEINRLTLVLDVSDSRDTLLRSNMGLEYEWNKILALRMGYHGLVLAKDKYKTYDTAGFTFGAGLHYDLRWTDLLFDYATANYGRLGNIHQFTLGLRF